MSNETQLKPIRMVDLVSQYQQIKPEIDAAIHSVIDRAAFINGQEVKDFQVDLEKYLGVKHVIPCANGTDALQIAFMALGLKPDDEVITASFTYVATAEVIGLMGLTPVLVDVDPDTFNLDPKEVEAAITPKTKAIVPVHLFGQCADMESLMALAAKHNLYVIEDTAQAIGAEYTFSDGRKQKAGTIGTIGTTSFFPSKNLGCFGDGGAIFTNDDALAAKMRMICNHGQSKQYYHDVIGVNSRLDSLQAAILGVKLKHLDSYAAARQKLADAYDNAFNQSAEADSNGGELQTPDSKPRTPNSRLQTPARATNSTHVFHQYTLKLNGVNRDELRAHLESKGIPSMIYYPVPCHKQKAFASSVTDRAYPVTEALCESVISLPMHTEMEEEQLDFIVASVIEFLIKEQ